MFAWTERVKHNYYTESAASQNNKDFAFLLPGDGSLLRQYQVNLF